MECSKRISFALRISKWTGRTFEMMNNSFKIRRHWRPCGVPYSHETIRTHKRDIRRTFHIDSSCVCANINRRMFILIWLHCTVYFVCLCARMCVCMQEEKENKENTKNINGSRNDEVSKTTVLSTQASTAITLTRRTFILNCLCSSPKVRHIRRQ